MKGWFNDQVTLANAVIGEVIEAMEHMTPEQWDNLAGGRGAAVVGDDRARRQHWIKLVALLRAPGRLKEEANTLIRGQPN